MKENTSTDTLQARKNRPSRHGGRRGRGGRGDMVKEGDVK